MKTIKKTNIVTDNMVLSLFTGNKSVWKWPWRFKTWKNKISKINVPCFRAGTIQKSTWQTQNLLLSCVVFCFVLFCFVFLFLFVCVCVCVCVCVLFWFGLILYDLLIFLFLKFEFMF